VSSILRHGGLSFRIERLDGRMRFWDMINFVAGGTVQFIKRLETDVTRFRQYCINHQGETPLSEKDMQRLLVAIKAARAVFDKFNDANITDCIIKIEMNIDKNTNNVFMYGLLYSLSDAVNTKFKSLFFYLYPKHKSDVLDKFPIEWEAVRDSFPDTIIDILDGVDCWAMDKNTASVFHMMRVLEYGLQWLSSEVKLEFTTQTWHTIIDQIEKRIGELQNSLPKGLARNERLQFLSESAKEFRYFKDGWRNYVSHKRITYDEYQARSVLEHVKAFMTTLSRQVRSPVSEEQSS
jgi:hypothetical protein